MFNFFTKKGKSSSEDLTNKPLQTESKPANDSLTPWISQALEQSSIAEDSYYLDSKNKGEFPPPNYDSYIAQQEKIAEDAKSAKSSTDNPVDVPIDNLKEPTDQGQTPSIPLILPSSYYRKRAAAKKAANNANNNSVPNGPTFKKPIIEVPYTRGSYAPVYNSSGVYVGSKKVSDKTLGLSNKDYIIPSGSTNEPPRTTAHVPNEEVPPADNTNVPINSLVPRTLTQKIEDNSYPTYSRITHPNVGALPRFKVLALSALNKSGRIAGKGAKVGATAGLKVTIASAKFGGGTLVKTHKGVLKYAPIASKSFAEAFLMSPQSVKNNNYNKASAALRRRASGILTPEERVQRRKDIDSELEFIDSKINAATRKLVDDLISRKKGEGPILTKAAVSALETEREFLLEKRKEILAKSFSRSELASRAERKLAAAELVALQQSSGLTPIVRTRYNDTVTGLSSMSSSNPVRPTKPFQSDTATATAPKKRVTRRPRQTAIPEVVLR